MGNAILNYIQEYGETNPTQAYIMCKTFDRIPQTATYEDVDNTFGELYQMGLIEKVDDINYKKFKKKC